MDGVPFVTQNRSRPANRLVIDFPLKQSGTYWMHSHYGLQEQLLQFGATDYLDARRTGKADRQVVVMLSDFSFHAARTNLEELKGRMQMASTEAESGWEKNGRDGFRENVRKQRRLVAGRTRRSRIGTIRSKGLFEQSFKRPRRTSTSSTMPSFAKPSDA